MFASAVKLGRQPLSYTHVWGTLDRTAKKARIGHVSSHTFRHTYRTWLDSVGTPVGVQQKLMRHSDIRTTMNIYGDAVTDDLRTASHSSDRPGSDVTDLQRICESVSALDVGVGDGNRTRNRRSHSPVLCQLSYSHRLR